MKSQMPETNIRINTESKENQRDENKADKLLFSTLIYAPLFTLSYGSKV